jgi:hypothetical protein
MTSPRLKLLFLFACSAELLSASAAESEGLVAFAQGDVRVNGKPARQGLALSSGDRVAVGKGRATLLIDGDRVVHLGSSSQLVVQELIKSGPAELKLEYGSVRSLVKSKSGASRPFRVRTAAAVMGVRGTQFYVEQPRGGALTGEGLRVATLEGEVAVLETRAPAPGRGPRTLVVGAGQGLRVAAVQAPASIAPLKDAELREVRAATPVANPVVAGLAPAAPGGPQGFVPPPLPPGVMPGSGAGGGFFQGFNPPMRIDLTID